MKKCVFILIIFCINFSLYAFDRSLIGSWGLFLNADGEREEIVRFGQNEIIVSDQLFRERDFEKRGDDTIFITVAEGHKLNIQYHLLSQNKLLFILWNPDSIEEFQTLILSRL